MEELALDREEGRRVVCGSTFSLLRTQDGRLMACGHNGFGQLGSSEIRRSHHVFEAIDTPGNVAQVALWWSARVLTQRRRNSGG